MGLLDEGENWLFKVVLGFHAGCTIASAVILGIHYNAKDVGTTYSTLNLVSASVAIIALANALLSSLNAFIGLPNAWSSGDETKLKMVSLNNARNIMTGTSMILAALVYGMEPEPDAWLTTTVVLFLPLARLLDTMLDTGGFGIAVQCPDKVERSDDLKEQITDALGEKFMPAMFAFLSLGTSIVLCIIYMSDIGFSWESESFDDTLLIIALVALCVHEVLILLTILLQVKAIQWKFLECFGKKDCGDGVKIHSLNEIPLVSALVFTYNLLSLSLLAGERFEEGKSINLLGAMIAIIGLAEIVGRRLI